MIILCSKSCWVGDEVKTVVLIIFLCNQRPSLSMIKYFNKIEFKLHKVVPNVRVVIYSLTIYVLERSAPALFRSLPAIGILSILNGVTAV